MLKSSLNLQYSYPSHEAALLTGTKAPSLSVNFPTFLLSSSIGSCCTTVLHSPSISQLSAEPVLLQQKDRMEAMVLG